MEKSFAALVSHRERVAKKSLSPKRSLLWAFLFCLSSLFSFPLSAQEYKYDFGGTISVGNYLGDANPKWLGVSPGGGIAFEGRYNHNFRTAFSSRLGYLYQPFNTKWTGNRFPIPGTNPEENRPPVKGVMHLAHWELLAEYHFVHYSDKFAYLQTRSLAPYIMGGVDIALGAGFKRWNVAPGITLGVGLKYKLRNRLNLIAALQGYHYFFDGLDAVSQETEWLRNPYRTNSGFLKGGDGRLALSVGVTYEFGVKRETCFGSKTTREEKK